MSALQRWAAALGARSIALFREVAVQQQSRGDDLAVVIKDTLDAEAAGHEIVDGVNRDSFRFSFDNAPIALPQRDDGVGHPLYPIDGEAERRREDHRARHVPHADGHISPIVAGQSTMRAVAQGTESNGACGLMILNNEPVVVSKRKITVVGFKIEVRQGRSLKRKEHTHLSVGGVRCTCPDAQ